MAITALDRTTNKVAPPFRADHVGSFLRPAYLIEAREQLHVVQGGEGGLEDRIGQGRGGWKRRICRERHGIGGDWRGLRVRSPDGTIPARAPRDQQGERADSGNAERPVEQGKPQSARERGSVAGQVRWT